MLKNIILLGIQGSGKGTQARKLATEYGYQIFETGGELRSIAKTKTPLGKKIATIINSGNLVDSETIMELVENFVHEQEGRPILFDGIPRNKDQYDAFIQLEAKLKLQTHIINFDLSDQKAKERITSRAKTENRADDTQEAIEKRISIFHSQTKPLLNEFAKSHEVVHINADQSIDDIYKELKSKINLNV